MIIVGAGAAGLYTAFELNNLGFNILVLEATDRIHGRIQSVSLGGVTTEVHAEGVTGSKKANWHFADIKALDKNRLLKYFLYTPSDNVLMSVDGIAVEGYSPGKKDFPGTVIYDYWDFYYTGEDYTGADIPAEDYICNTLGVCRDTGQVLTDSDKAFHLYDMAYPGGEFATGLAQPVSQPAGVVEPRIAMRSVAEQESLWELGIGEWAFTTSTWEQTLDELYFQTIKDLPGVIQTNSPVSAIDTSGSQVVVTHSGNQTATADAVVVTVSLGVLKAGDITFTPALSAAKLDAMDTLGVGTGGKMMLQFSSTPTKPGFTGWFPEGPGSYCWNYFYRESIEPNARNVMTCFVMGEQAENLSALGEAAAITAQVASLDAMCTGTGTAPGCLSGTPWADAFVAGFWHQGNLDPAHKGVYSYPAVSDALANNPNQSSYPTDGSPSAREVLAAQVGTKLYFAGEATDTKHSATVFGALDSGLRAAGEVDADHNPGGP